MKQFSEVAPVSGLWKYLDSVCPSPYQLLFFFPLMFRILPSTLPRLCDFSAKYRNQDCICTVYLILFRSLKKAGTKSKNNQQETKLNPNELYVYRFGRVLCIVKSGLAKQHQRLFVTSGIFMVKFLLKYFTSWVDLSVKKLDIWADQTKSIINCNYVKKTHLFWYLTRQFL